MSLSKQERHKLSTLALRVVEVSVVVNINVYKMVYFSIKTAVVFYEDF
jgi:hypothetical protein